MSPLIRRLPLPALGAGALLLGLGLWAAAARLPEWRAPHARDPRVLGALRARFAAEGGRLSGARFSFSTAGTYTMVERAWRRLGTSGGAFLEASGYAGGLHVQGTLDVPGAGTGPVDVSVAASGEPVRVDWVPGGSMFALTTPDSETTRARHAFAARVRALLARGAPLGPESNYSRGGNATIHVQAVLGTSPAEVVVTTETPNAFVAVARELADPDAARRLGVGLVQKALVRAGPVAVLVVLAVVLFAVLLFRHRVSFRIGLAVASLALVSMLVGGFSPDDVSGGVGTLVVLIIGRLGALGFLLVLWIVAESFLRETIPGFTTSLDTFAAGRLGPRGGRAILGGLGIGAAVQGLRLLTLSAAAGSFAPDVRPDTFSFALPFLNGTSSPFFEGPYETATLILFIALLRIVLPRGAAESAAALVFALFVSLRAPLEPWGAGFALALAIAILFLVSFRTYGLAALLVTATTAALLRDVAGAARYIDGSLGTFAFCAAALVAIVVVGLLALSRPEREEEGRLDAPEYVRRVESERRVKYEMDLLSRMQLAMLPAHPPQVAGLDISVHTVLATEAGGDLYEFIEDDGRLWIAAGDVAGHGYSCGIQGAMVKAALLSLARDGRTPAAVLGEVDRVLRAAKAGRLFTTLALLKLDPKTGTGLLANAGHPFPVLVSEGKCREVAGSGLPLGQGPPRTYADVPIALPEGSSLVLASDGLYEGPDRFDDPYGYARPCAVLESVGLWRRPAEAIVEALFADWRNHVGEGAPSDDTTVLVVKRPALAW